MGGGELGRIKLAIVGVGNCASSLVQGIEFYKGKRPEETSGLLHWEIGGYRPSDIEEIKRAALAVGEVLAGL